jgi:hypothetical protein
VNVDVLHELIGAVPALIGRATGIRCLFCDLVVGHPILLRDVFPNSYVVNLDVTADAAGYVLFSSVSE